MGRSVLHGVGPSACVPNAFRPVSIPSVSSSSARVADHVERTMLRRLAEDVFCNAIELTTRFIALGNPRSHWTRRAVAHSEEKEAVPLTPPKTAPNWRGHAVCREADRRG